MRKLKTSDIPALCRCLKNIGIKDEIKSIANKSTGVKDAWAMGFDLLYNIFDLATEKKGETELYKFLAGPLEMTPEQVENLDFDVLLPILKQLAAENNLAAFFKSAAPLMK